MNIAVILTKDINEGGAFQAALAIFQLLNENKSSAYNFIFFTNLKGNLDILEKYGISATYFSWSNFDRFKSYWLNSQFVCNVFNRINKRLESRLDKILKKHNIGLVYFLSPTDLALSLNCHHYIFTIWDLCFFDFMEFPEVYLNKEFERREGLFRLAVLKAIAVITDSDSCKKDIIKRYNVSEQRVVSVPFLPWFATHVYDKNLVDIKKKYNISGEYIFYPAQFWPHKNHVYILEGLKILQDKHKIKISAIFSGSDKRNLPVVLKKAKELGISDQIYCIGFVENDQIACLYAQALALVMPTYFGPTNIPPLEAFVVGCPVLYSDLPGLRQQVEGAAILLDLKNPESLSNGLIKIIQDRTATNTMIENGRKKIAMLMKEDRWSKLKGIFDDYALKARCWR